jgi:hypothetical protein
MDKEQRRAQNHQGGKGGADAEIEVYQQRQWKAYHTSNREFAKCEKYCREQRMTLSVMQEYQRAASQDGADR